MLRGFRVLEFQGTDSWDCRAYATTILKINAVCVYHPPYPDSTWRCPWPKPVTQPSVHLALVGGPHDCGSRCAHPQWLCARWFADQGAVQATVVKTMQSASVQWTPSRRLGGWGRERSTFAGGAPAFPPAMFRASWQQCVSDITRLTSVREWVVLRQCTCTSPEAAAAH